MAEKLADLCPYDAALALSPPDGAVSVRLSEPGLTTAEIIRIILGSYAARPALAERCYEIVADAVSGIPEIRYLPAFRTLSYGQLASRIEALRNVWQGEQNYLCAEGSLVAILGFTSVDYVTVDMACVLAGLTSVPLQTNMNSEDLALIVREVEPACLFASLENAAKALSALILSGHGASLVVMDYEPQDGTQQRIFESVVNSAAEHAIPVSTLNDILERGIGLRPATSFVPVAGKDPLATIFYTSGSTGVPKGAMYPDSLFCQWWSAPGTGQPVIALAYQPLNHGLGRMTVIRALNQGGICCFVAKSDMSTLFEDARLVQPTAFAFVPRVAELVYDQYRGEVARRVSEGVADQAARREVMDEMRATCLGGRLQMASTATAPLMPEIADFVSRCFDIVLDDNYGSTEAGGISVNGTIIRPMVEDYKLIDVPELGYFASDKPNPRGELLVKTKWTIPGYYKHPELTAKLFDSEGFLITGDIVEERGPDRIAYLDRRNNVFKLAQGEFVAVAHLEALLAGGHPLIRQAFLYGDSMRAYLVAVLVPDLDAVRAQLGRDAEPAELKALMRDAVKLVASSNRLRAYEVPRDFLVESEPFSVANGLLSDVGKHLRPKLKIRYGEQLEGLYTQIAERQERDLATLRSGEGGGSVLAKVKLALESVLGLMDLDETRSQNFADMGGDSLAAVSLLSLLEEIFNVSVPVGIILDPTGSPQRLADYIEATIADTGRALGYADVHVPAATEIPASDLSLSRLIDQACLDGQLIAGQSDKPARRVLITGANGFLGRFVCMEWLEQVSAVGGKVICIARGRDAAVAYSRIREAFDRGDERLLARFDALAKDHLEVVSGDFSRPRLGLSDVEFDRLAREIDLIVHVGALVNHVLSYQDLFEPNVLGTAELIRLAATSRPKQIDYVSTIAVCFLSGGEPIGEDEDIRRALPVCKLRGGYASGYAISKWASEILLRNAHDALGIPINIFRADMVLAHSEYAGQINPSDIFTRLLLSVAQTGVAPSSFYRNPNSEKANAYDGLPVDFIARSMARISAASEVGYATYNISNLEKAEATLDDIVGWVADAGYAIKRVGDHADWYQQFEARLRALPEKQRLQSSLPVISQLREPTGETGRIDAHRFHEALAAFDEGQAQSGKITAGFIAKCMADLEVLALLGQAPIQPGRGAYHDVRDLGPIAKAKAIAPNTRSFA